MRSKYKLKFDDLDFRIDLILPTIVLSLGLLLLYIPIWGIEIKSFDRTLGNGILHGIDAARRINNINFFDFLLVPTIFFLVYLTIWILCRNVNGENNECLAFINNISAISLAALIFAHLNKFSNKDFLSLEVIFPCILIVIGIIFLSISQSKKKFNFDVFKWCIFAAIPISLLAVTISYNFGITMLIDKLVFSDAMLNGPPNNVLNIVLFLSIYTISFTMLFLICTIYYEKINFVILKKAYTFVIISPIAVTLFLEVANILNQYSIIINSKLKITFIIYLLSIVTSIVYYLFMTSRGSSCENYCFEKYYYPILLIAFAFISVQIPLQNTINTDFFEQSNHGTAINQLFNYGKLPMIETFDAHMMQNQIGNILYGLLNNDFQGAIFLGYSLLPIFVILYYLLFKKFFNEDVAFLLMSLFPITSENTFKVFSLAPIVILSFLYAYRTKKYKGYMLYWASIVITCLFRLDMGFALALASITSWAVVWLYKKNTISIKKMSLSCLYIIAVTFIFFLTVCLLKNISPLQRVIEFLKLCQSNINWAYSSIGDPSMTAFTLCYFIIPSLTGIIIIMLMRMKYKNNEFIPDDKFIIILIIGLLCIFNLSRGIVRHSLAESKNIYIVSSAPLFFSMCIYIFNKKNKLLSFVVSNTVFMIVLSLMINLNSIFPRSLLNTSISKYLSFEPYKTMTVSEKVDRVILSDDMKKVYLPLKEVFDKTLALNETYIDFTNQTLLYALTGREKPMYVNQSPGLLSGEYTQQQFIQQCEQLSDRAPFVLMPIEPMLLSNDLDEIQNSYRYYLVSEYISNNFRPLFRTSQFAIWCRKDRFDEKFNLVSKLTEGNRDTYSKVMISDECTKILSNHSESISVINNQLELKSTSADPYLAGLEKLMDVDEILSDSKYINISIEYESDRDGLFELFYTTDKGEDFNPQKAISKNMSKSGVFEATIPFTEYTSIRFDIPEGSVVKVKSVSFRGLKDLNLDSMKILNYNYVPLSYHSYHLMNIPYIWASYDKISIDKKEEQLIINKNSSIYNFNSINKQDGNYLFISSSSVKGGIMTIQLGKEDEQGFVPLSQFDFSLKDGKDQKYLIRLSSDFMWYSEQINSIKITSDNNSIVEKLSILKGDTLK